MFTPLGLFYDNIKANFAVVLKISCLVKTDLLSNCQDN